MNCEGFKDRIYEYLDGSLSREAQAEIREHLRHCVDCRCAFEREKALTQGLRHSLQRATDRLVLRPGTLANVLRAREAESAPISAFVRAWQWFISSPFRPVSAGALLAMLLLAFLALPGHREPAADSVSRAAAAKFSDALVVDVPIQTQTRFFRRQDSVVIDTIASSVAVGHARLLENKP